MVDIVALHSEVKREPDTETPGGNNIIKTIQPSKYMTMCTLEDKEKLNDINWADWTR
jgi:hypothetical protein